MPTGVYVRSEEQLKELQSRALKPGHGHAKSPDAALDQSPKPEYFDGALNQDPSQNNPTPEV